MKVRILAELPMPIVFGGLELQCLNTTNALKTKIDNIAFLDYHNKNDTFDILHIFGNPPGLYETCYHISKRKKIVISAVCGAESSSYKSYLKKIILSSIARKFNLQTDYDRLHYMFKNAAKIICLNELEKTFIAQQYNITKDKLTIVHNGVDEVFFNADRDVFEKKYGFCEYVLFTGNITKRKNPLKLAKVLNKLDIRGVFIGNLVPSEIQYGNYFKNEISRGKNLLWIKHLPQNSTLLASSYAAARVFCLPSQETQSLSALEAMAAGTPIILGDYPHAYQDPFKNSLRCNPHDFSSIEGCVRSAMENPSKYYLPLQDKFRWQCVAENIINVYADLMRI